MAYDNLKSALEKLDKTKVLKQLSPYLDKSKISQSPYFQEDFDSYQEEPFYFFSQFLNITSIRRLEFAHKSKKDLSVFTNTNCYALEMGQEQYKLLFDIVYENTSFANNPKNILKCMNLILKNCIYLDFYNNKYLPFKGIDTKFVDWSGTINYIIDKIDKKIEEEKENIAIRRVNFYKKEKVDKVDFEIVNETVSALKDYLEASLSMSINVENINTLDKLVKNINNQNKLYVHAKNALFFKKFKSFDKLLEYINPKWENSELLNMASLCGDIPTLQKLITLSTPKKNNSIALFTTLSKNNRVDDNWRREAFHLLLPHSCLVDALSHCDFGRREDVILLDFDLFIDHLTLKDMRKIIKNYPQIANIPQIQKRSLTLELEKDSKSKTSTFKKKM